MARRRPFIVAEEDGMLIAGMVAAVAATVLIFFAAYQTPVRHDDAASRRSPRAVVNATEEWKVWSRRPADER